MRFIRFMQFLQLRNTMFVQIAVQSAVLLYNLLRGGYKSHPMGGQKGRVEVPCRPPGGVLALSVGFKTHQARFAQFDSTNFVRFGELWTRLRGVSEESLKAIF